VRAPRSEPFGEFTLSIERASDSIDERLASIVESIRSWDWRSSTFGEGEPQRRSAMDRHPSNSPGPPPAPEPDLRRDADLDFGPAAFGNLGRTATATAPRPQFESGQRTAPWQPPQGHTATIPDAFEPPMTPTRPTIASAMPPPVMLDPKGTQVGLERDLGEAAPVLHRSSRRWTNAIPWVVAVIVVVVLVAVIRSQSPGSTSGDLTPVSVKSGSHAAFVLASPTVVTQFTDASTRLDTANVAISHALANSKGASVAQVTQEVTPYVTSLSEFVYTLHFVAWPQALQVPAQDLTLRAQALISFLRSISSESTASLNSWFAQLRSLANETETADNLVRRDIGLAATSSYP
jgi:hypothetical protein